MAQRGRPKKTTGPKIYQLIKDGHIIGQYSLLEPAKKKAVVEGADVYEGHTLLQSYTTIKAEYDATLPKGKTGYERAVEKGLIKGVTIPQPTPEEKILLSSEKGNRIEEIKILSNLLNVRTEPNLQAPILGTIQKDDIYQTHEMHEDWFKIRFNGQYGWCWSNNGTFACKK